VFIRNYLTGHEYLRSVGLIDQVLLVAWLPDDFGHDPQLPALIEAMGMKAIGLSRIPGSPQPTLCPSQQPANNFIRANGLSFYWPANDGSSVLTHFMPATYYGITSGLDNSDMLSKDGIQGGVRNFLDANYDGVVWPGGTIFATEGGDWQFPTSTAQGGSAAGAYDWSDLIGAAIRSSSGDVTVTTQLGTFADYYNALMQTPGDIPSLTLYAENYWTGYFASRPQLKIDQYSSAQMLLGAEILGSILTVYDGTGPLERAALADDIAAGWNLLVPTTHHDFVTGTSPDTTYIVDNPPANPTWDAAGQLAMSANTVKLAAKVLGTAMEQLRHAVAAAPGATEIPVVVFNQTGCDLPDTAIVEMEDVGGGGHDFEVRVGASIGPVQRSSTGTLLFQVPGMRAMSYQVVYLIALGTVTAPVNEPASGEFPMSNGSVDLILSENDGWAIKQMVIDGKNHVQQNGTYANRIGIWNDLGNLYQFGMEYMNDCTEGTFEFDSFLTSVDGNLVEKGPVRWRFNAVLQDRWNHTYTTQYDLVRGETMVRITTAGTAPAAEEDQSGWSVLTSFAMQTAGRQTASVLEYGTSYYWENRDPQESWSGPTFRACRDFAQLATASEPVAAVYQSGMPAWTIDEGILLGCLLRNTPGGQRGAMGYDTDPHTQHYTLDVQGELAITGYPLRTSLYTQTPLHAAEVATETRGTMRDGAQLASVAQSNAVLRVGKMNPPTAESGRDLILRVQQSCTGSQQLDINLPFLASGGTRAWPEIVTALEAEADNAPAVTLTDTTASFQANRALWTMRVPVTDPATR
jgi:alpha-mannosidase